MLNIRDAAAADAPALLQIYDHYVKNTAVSFDIDTPSEEEFRRRLGSVTEHYPYLVIERDGVIEGYAYAHLFVGREAYSHSCEVTIYLRNSSTHLGYGRLLYEALEAKLRSMGIINLYACIGVTDKEDQHLTNNSASFHEHMGYKTVGVFKSCGRKFGCWYDMIWMEKIIGEHTADAPPVKWYKRVDC